MVESAHCTCMGGLGEVCSHIGAFFWNQSFVFPKAAQRGYAIGMNLSLSIQYHMLKCQTYHLPCQSPLLIAKKKGAHLYMETVPISDLPQPSISSELPEPLSIVSKPSHPFCVSAFRDRIK